MSSSANRTQIAYTVETGPGVTPVSPRMRTCRITNDGLTYTVDYQDSDELRPDRMLGDPTQTIKSAAGTLNYEMSYPVDQTFLSDMISSALFATWTNSPVRFNDTVAASVITNIGTAANTLACVTGTPFVTGMLVQTSGFANAANNAISKVTTGGSTSFVASAASFVAETSPPGTARAKVVGFQGASSDITATAAGLSSTTLDFTTFGLLVGQWVKIGGTATVERFATSGINDFARVTAIAAHALTLDNLPPGWTTDAGAGKAIKVWFGDTIRNGSSPTAIAQVSTTIEKGFLGQAVPTYIVYKGMTVGQMTFATASRAKITGQITFMGMSGGASTTTLDSSIDPADSNAIMAANANVGRVAEAGSKLSGPNWVQEMTITINNNLRQIDDISSQSPVAIEPGEFTVTANPNTLFGDNTLLTKFYNSTPTSLSMQIARNNQSLIFQIPRATYRDGGQPQATAKNTDVKAQFTAQASYDPSTLCHLIIDRFEYVELN